MLAAILATALLRGETTYVPAQTRVLVVAPIDASGDTVAATSAEEVAEAKATIESGFAKRGFVVVTGDDATAATRAAGVDLTARANRTLDNLYKIGAAANARLVVFTTIEKTSQKMKSRMMSSRLEGYAKLQTWLLDVTTKQAILDGEEKGADATSAGKAEKNRQVHAVHLALDEQLDGFMKRYPKVEK